MAYRKMYFAVDVCVGSPNGEEDDVQLHEFRPTITDMDDKYCGNCISSILMMLKSARIMSLLTPTGLSEN